MLTARAGILTTVFQRIRQVRFGAMQRRRQSEKESGHNRNHESKNEYMPIQSDLRQSRYIFRAEPKQGLDR